MWKEVGYKGEEGERGKKRWERRGDKKGKEKTRGRREEERNRGGRVKRDWREMQETITLDTSTYG